MIITIVFCIFYVTQCSTIKMMINDDNNNNEPKDYVYTYEYVEEFKYEEYTDDGELKLDNVDQNQYDLSGEYDEHSGFGDGNDVYADQNNNNNNNNNNNKNQDQQGFGQGDTLHTSEEPLFNEEGFGEGEELFTEEQVEQEKGFGNGEELYNEEEEEKVNQKQKGFGDGNILYNEEMDQQDESTLKGFGDIIDDVVLANNNENNIK